MQRSHVRRPSTTHWLRRPQLGVLGYCASKAGTRGPSSLAVSFVCTAPSRQQMPSPALRSAIILSSALLPLLATSNNDGAAGAAAGDGGVYQAKIEALYKTYNPSKLSSVPDLLEKYTGHEEALLQKIRDKYLEERRGGATKTEAEGDDILMGEAEDLVEAQITALYQKHRPEKLTALPALLQKYTGAEHQLLAALKQKYEPESDSEKDMEKRQPPPGLPHYCKLSTTLAATPQLLQAQSPTLGRPPNTAERRWLTEEASQRAPQYIKNAERTAIKGLRKRVSQSAEHVADFLYHSHIVVLQQVLAALDLSPTQSTQLDAAKLMLAVADLVSEDDDAGETRAMLKHAVSLAAAACRNRNRRSKSAKSASKKRLLALQKWAKDPNGVLLSDSPTPRAGIRKQLGESVKGWLKQGPPDLALLYQYSNTTSDNTGPVGDTISSAVAASFTDQLIFPTHVMTTNVLAILPSGFCERLAALAIRKYAQFKTERSWEGLDIEQLNHAFFHAQSKSGSQLKDPVRQRWWPEMYTRSEDFAVLRKVMRAALTEFASRHGLTPPREPSAEMHPDMYDVAMWAAVSPADVAGSRHGSHVHEGSLASCVLYMQTVDEPLPLVFVDPRGGQPTRYWEAEKSEHDPDYQRKPSY
jgi:hypothetical protein